MHLFFSQQYIYIIILYFQFAHMFYHIAYLVCGITICTLLIRKKFVLSRGYLLLSVSCYNSKPQSLLQKHNTQLKKIKTDTYSF